MSTEMMRFGQSEVQDSGLETPSKFRKKMRETGGMTLQKLQRIA